MRGAREVLTECVKDVPVPCAEPRGRWVKGGDPGSQTGWESHLQAGEGAGESRRQAAGLWGLTPMAPRLTSCDNVGSEGGEEVGAPSAWRWRPHPRGAWGRREGKPAAASRLSCSGFVGPHQPFAWTVVPNSKNTKMGPTFRYLPFPAQARLRSERLLRGGGGGTSEPGAAGCEPGRPRVGLRPPQWAWVSASSAGRPEQLGTGARLGRSLAGGQKPGRGQNRWWTAALQHGQPRPGGFP